MPYTNSPITALIGQGGPKAGFSSVKPELLSGDQRQTMGLGAAPGSTQKKTLDGAPNGLGKDDFLKLLLAQLSNQDPLKPLEDKEFIAQLAQFNTLEQMQQMNTHMLDLLAGMSLAEGSNLLGRFVEAAGVSGTVNSVNMVGGKAQITISTADGDVQVALTQVTRVLQAEPDAVDEVEETEETVETEPAP
ncbi:MAG TPA: flagellar hook capping FlgD N-terminal domain-containing protein [Chloroflexota bacterium]|nr:flagellar hook capping FlgD N-terminal domain-containing protein [Chloroflexota bacterium]